MNYFPPFFIAKKGGAKKSRPLGSFLENYVSIFQLSEHHRFVQLGSMHSVLKGCYLSVFQLFYQ